MKDVSDLDFKEDSDAEGWTFKQTSLIFPTLSDKITSYDVFYIIYKT